MHTIGKAAYLFVEFTNPGIFLDLPIGKLACALFSRNLPYPGQDRVHSLEIPPNHNMQEPYRYTRKLSVPRLKECTIRDFHLECRRKSVPSLVPRERGQQGTGNRSLASRTVGSGPLFLKKSLSPTADDRAMNTSAAFSAVTSRVRNPKRMTDTCATHGKVVQTLRTRVPAFLEFRPFRIQHENRQG